MARALSSEIGKATYRLNLFTAEIMHFVHQMQYYVLFEVIECSWVELQKRVQQATALGDILDAHSKLNIPPQGIKNRKKRPFKREIHTEKIP